MGEIISFDFDGVIHSYGNGWQGIDVANDPPTEGIKELIDELHEKGYQIYIFSSRCKTYKGIECIQNYMQKYGIYYDEICKDKPPAFVTLDDRAICFKGDTEGLVEEIDNFKPWTQQ